jgi:hypothetical protein
MRERLYPLKSFLVNLTVDYCLFQHPVNKTLTNLSRNYLLIDIFTAN